MVLSFNSEITESTKGKYYDWIDTISGSCFGAAMGIL
jgi:hypothetical protein